MQRFKSVKALSLLRKSKKKEKRVSCVKRAILAFPFFLITSIDRKACVISFEALNFELCFENHRVEELENFFRIVEIKYCFPEFREN